MKRSQHRYIYFTVFVSGMTTLAAELSASRLIGNVFGTSNLVWAAIISLILIYLTAGYFIGGRWADRSPYPRTMYSVLAWGAFTLGIVPYVAQPVLLAAATAFDGLQVGVLFGSFVAVLILFSVPVTLLGMVSPFAIRLCMNDTTRAGNISGDIYAVSTLGGECWNADHAALSADGCYPGIDSLVLFPQAAKEFAGTDLREGVCVQLYPGAEIG